MAQNSKKNNFNEGKIEQHLEYIENRLNEYYKALEEADEDNKIIIAAEIQKHGNRKDFYNNLSIELEQNGDTQISTADPDSRQLITRNNITEVAYNVQTAVVAKHYLPLIIK